MTVGTRKSLTRLEVRRGNTDLHKANIVVHLLTGNKINKHSLKIIILYSNKVTASSQAMDSRRATHHRINNHMVNIANMHHNNKVTDNSNRMDSNKATGNNRVMDSNLNKATGNRILSKVMDDPLSKDKVDTARLRLQTMLDKL